MYAVRTLFLIIGPKRYERRGLAFPFLFSLELSIVDANSLVHIRVDGFRPVFLIQLVFDSFLQTIVE